MKKTSVAALFAATSIVALSAATSAFAAQNVANTTQKGSLLIWPAITVNTLFNQSTLVEISNDSFDPVHVKCEYVNELKGRQPFDFELSGKETASWDALNGSTKGDEVNPPNFPTTTGTPTSPYPPFPMVSADRGELVCFAVDITGSFQIAWNELTGTATPVRLNDTQSLQPKEAYRYNAWAFAARNATGLAPDDPTDMFGTPGILPLDGANTIGHYDACPAYNIQNFMGNGATLGNVTLFENDLHVVSCYQDLRQDYVLHLTKLLFTIWNSKENSFEGTYECADSVLTLNLIGPSVNPSLVNPGSFDFATLKTPNARFILQGVASDQCTNSAATGLLGVVSSDVGLANTVMRTDQTGSNTQGAGISPGTVWWDIGGGGPPPALQVK